MKALILLFRFVTETGIVVRDGCFLLESHRERLLRLVEESLMLPSSKPTERFLLPSDGGES